MKNSNQSSRVMDSARNARERTGEWSEARKEFASRVVRSGSFAAKDAASRAAKEAATKKD
jgi:hypothetical protein